MARFISRKKPEQIGGAPGAFIFRGTVKVSKPELRLFNYSANSLVEKTIDSVEDCLSYVNDDSVTWLNIYGLNDADLMSKIETIFNVNPLILEDVMNTFQRPKLEEYNNCVFLTLKMLKYMEEKRRVDAEQLSIILMKNLVITFQEKHGDVFDPVRERIRNPKKKIRNATTDYLVYALLDTVYDNYVDIVSRMGDRIDELEEQVIDFDDNDTVLEGINTFKREINYLRRMLRPAWELTNRLIKLESNLIHDETDQYLKELNDNITHAVEATDSYRESLSDQLNIYHTNLSSRMNDVMKVLTIFSAIFIPLTFIAGIYGTNFRVLPELQYQYSYYIMLSVMVIISGIMLWYFRRKHWL